MRNFHLLHAIRRGVWYIDADAVQTLLPYSAAFLKGQEVRMYDEDREEREMKNQPYALCAAAATASPDRYKSYDEAPKNSVAVIPLLGALTKYDYCYEPGMLTRGAQIQQADGHPNIAAILLRIDSPGGSADGLKTLADLIKNTEKPIVAFVNGMMCSAAMWLGSACDLIIASDDLNIIGSIGCMMAWADVKPYYEEMGVKFHEVYAEQSKDKNKTSRDANTGHYKPLQEELLNPAAAMFISAIKANRPDVSDDALTGKTYLNEDAQARGLIDEIGTFDYAVQRASGLARTHAPASQTQSSNKTQNQMKLKSAWTSLLAVFGISLAADATTSEHQVDMTEETLEKLNAELAAKAAVEAQLTEANATAEARQKQIEALTAQVTSLTQERDEARAEAAAYGAQPGERPTHPVQRKTDAIDSRKDVSQETIDALPHNAALDADPRFAARPTAND
ncbi:protease-4 [Catalinimonas alkaloidigena]|uniref:Protease-4 n=1 Tax=Catalinimonas alkaloidigena TaxID=1075417 RepID=A0A1G9B795_9BACT|nr:S49 family peptidase [Catalinimonas alkaloidigena]SDK35369.1 protease-4 [Catalinimonas alkaloidigena]